MGRKLYTRSDQARRWRWLLAGPALTSLGLSGCATFWDDVTNKNFKFKHWFEKSDPMVVLNETDDGDKKAKAIRALKEERDPKKHEVVLKTLTTVAVHDRHPYCRLAAIQKLGEFKDPRAVEALAEAYYSAKEARTPSGYPLFPHDTITAIQCQALTSLGNTRQPAAVDLLARVAREPRPDFSVSEMERQQWLDIHIAAARALGNFNHYQATEALVHVLREEKDVALRTRAHESLQQATGKKLPADAEAWEELINKAPREGTAKGGKPNGWRELILTSGRQ
ncbi:MAG: HEAT repeat domain-containing protein [Gemmataceae bacterium]